MLSFFFLSEIELMYVHAIVAVEQAKIQII